TSSTPVRRSADVGEEGRLAPAGWVTHWRCEAVCVCDSARTAVRSRNTHVSFTCSRPRSGEARRPSLEHEGVDTESTGSGEGDREQDGRDRERVLHAVVLEAESAGMHLRDGDNHCNQERNRGEPREK